MAETDVLVAVEWLPVLRAGGVVRTGEDDAAAADLEGWVAATDRELIVLDTQDCSTEHELLAAFGAAFGVGEDVDCEWDTIDDCLADRDVSPASGLVIVWTGWDGLDEDPEHVIPTAVDALATAAATWADEGRPWAVLLVGDGPSWDLPWAGAGPAPWEGAEDLAEEDWDDGDDAVELPDGEYEVEEAELSHW